MEWESILANAIEDGCIREIYLKKIPVLRNTNNWRDVKPVGWIDHKMKYSHYKGGLVKLNDKMYFVQDKTIKAIDEFIKFRFPEKITVID